MRCVVPDDDKAPVRLGPTEDPGRPESFISFVRERTDELGQSVEKRAWLFMIAMKLEGRTAQFLH